MSKPKNLTKRQTEAWNKKQQIRSAKFRKEHPDLARANSKKYRLKNPEAYKKRAREYARKRLIKHREQINNRRRQLHAENPEPDRERQKKWKRNNPEKVAASRLKRLFKQRIFNRNRSRADTQSLSDVYVAAKLHISVKTARMFPELIESHRSVIRIKRSLKTR